MSQTKAQLLDPTGVFTLTDQLVAVGATFSGNVSIAGTLTKQDVTNVDSVGLITARAGIRFSTTASYLGADTSDASDNKYLAITGGGAVSQSRGASVVLYGNEESNFPGQLNILAGNAGSAPIKLYTGGSQRLEINSGGVVRLISADSPSSTTEPAQISNHAGGLQIYGSSASGTNRNIIFGTNSVAAGEVLRIASDGKVGIKTSSPGSPLEVNGGSALDTATFNSHHAQGVLINLQRSGTNIGFLGSGKNVADATGGVDDIGLRAQANLIFTTGGGTERLRIDSSGNVGINTTTPAANLEISGNQIGNAVAISGTAIDCSLGNYFTKTITGATAFTFSNVPASGKEYSLTIELTLNGSNAVTWPAAVKWPGDAAPAITDAKTQLFMLVTRDGGTKWRGSSLVDYTT